MPSSFQTRVNDDGLVLWLPFDDGTGRDFSGYGNDGALVSVAEYKGFIPSQNAEGYSSRAFTFNGTTSSINCGPVPVSAVRTFTILAWIRLTSLSASNDIVGSSATSGVLLGVLNSTGVLRLVQQGTASIATSTGAVAVNTWTHVGVSYNTSGNWTFYINGLRDSFGTNSVVCVTGNVQIGHGSEFCTGQIDDVRYYNRVLQPGEIFDIYSRSFQPTPEVLLPALFVSAAANPIFATDRLPPIWVPKTLPNPSQSLNPNLFTNPVPFNQYDWPKPYFPRILPYPQDGIDINNFTNPVPFNQYDWNKPYFPVTRPYPQDGININIFTNPVPFNQYDWSKPFFPHFLPDPQVGINTNIFTNPFPTSNIDASRAYPVRGTALPDQAYNQSLYTVIVTTIPFNQTDWSITARQRPQPQPDQQYNPNLFTNPIPVLNADAPRSLAVRAQSPADAPYNQNLYTVVVSAAPFNQTDWAVPVRQRSPAPTDQQFNPNLYANPIPFNQTDFSPAHRVPQAPFDLSFALNLNIFTNPIPIFNFDYTPQRKPLPVPLDPNQGFNVLYQPIVTVTLLQRTLTGVGL